MIRGMQDTKIRELERRYQSSGLTQDLIAWVTERVRSGDTSLAEAELIDSIRRHPSEPSLRCLLAEWIEVDVGACAEFLEAETAVIASPKDEAAWERYHQARAAAPGEWLARVEQPSLMRICPLPVEPVWVSSGIGDFRPVEGTFGGSQLATCPDLPVDRVRDFAWLAEGPLPRGGGSPYSEEEVAAWAEKIRRQGFEPPEALMTLFREHLAQSYLIDSCTDCYFTLEFEPVRALGGLVVTFYNDSQSCVTWGLWLHESGAQAVVCFYLLWEGEGDLPPDASEPMNEDGLRIGGFGCVSPSLEAFVYRTYVENEIWFGLHDMGEPRDLTQPELASYLDHYR